MGYFAHTEDSLKYSDEWEDLLEYIKSGWCSSWSDRLGDLNHHIEAKALYTFTMSRRLMEAARSLARKGDRENWKPVFVEASLLLFPMLELVGQARLGDNKGSALSSGIDWLRDPSELPTPGRHRHELKEDQDRVETLGSYMKTLREGPKIMELFHLRNYFTHGLKQQGDRDFDIGAVQTCMNYELPYAMVQQARVSLAAYWGQLTSDTANQAEWISRLAKAEIFPFYIMGSPRYEKGLIDPDIIDWISSLDASST